MPYVGRGHKLVFPSGRGPLQYRAQGLRDSVVCVGELQGLRDMGARCSDKLRGDLVRVEPENTVYHFPDF